MPCDQFPAKRRNKQPSPIDVTLSRLSKSPVSSSLDNVVPQSIVRSPRVQPGQFGLPHAKRLLQQNLPDADIHHYSAQSLRPSVNTIRYSPLSVLREYVVPVLHHRVAREPALPVVCVGRTVPCRGWLRPLGLRVIVELPPPPPAAVREPLAVLHHETSI